MDLTPTAEQDAVAGESVLRHAIKLDPSLAIAYSWLSFALEQQGRSDEAKEIRLRGLEIDPLNPPLVINTANRESASGNFDRAEQLLMRLMALPEPPAGAYFNRASLYRDWGRKAAEMRVGKEIVRNQVTDDPMVLQSFVEAYERLGMPEQADRWMAFLGEYGGDDTDLSDARLRQLAVRGAQEELEDELRRNARLATQEGRDSDIGYELLRATSQIQLGQYSEGAAIIESLFEPDVPSLVEQHDPAEVFDVMQDLALAWKSVGREGEARVILEDIDEILSRFVDSGAQPAGLESYALNRALLGDTPGAIAALDRALELGWSDYATIANDIAWKETRELPEFQPILAKAKAALEEQRKLVEADEAETDFLAEAKEILAR